VTACGGRPLPVAVYWRLKRRGAAQAEVLAGSGLPPARREVFDRRFRERIEDPAALALDRLLPGAAATLATLAGQGRRLALLSLRRSAEAFLGQVAALGIAGAFERVCSGRAAADPGQAKARLIEQVGYGAGAVVVGDTEADILAAAALGLASVGVTTGLRNAGYLRRIGAGTVVDRLARVPAAISATQAASSAMPSSRATSGR
jgi:phosphoglycolate phosphatase